MLRFSIRELLLLTVIVAMALGWFLDRGRLAARARDADSFEQLSKQLLLELKNTYPPTSITITVNGRDVEAIRSYTFPDSN